LDNTKVDKRWLKNNIRTRMPTMNDKIAPNNKAIKKACYKHLEGCNINFLGQQKGAPRDVENIKYNVKGHQGHQEVCRGC
jgi:hypothetical protein